MLKGLLKQRKASSCGKRSFSHHHQTQPTPEVGALVPISANPQNSFPFDARMRLTNAMKEREARLKNFKVLNPIYPDLGLLRSLEICGEVKEFFDDNGLAFVFEEDPPAVYEPLVREFIYSFTPEWRVVSRQQSSLCVAEKHVVAWKFRLGGVEYNYSREELLRAFDLEDRTTYPYGWKSGSDEFWKFISGGTDNFVSSEPSTKIALPVWRLVHRFLSACVIMRKDEGRWVSKSDLEIMRCFYEEVEFDTLTPITKSLEESTNPSFRGTYIGGGPFITMLAMDIGYSLDPEYAMPRKILGEEEMIRRGFVKLKRSRAGVVRRLVGRDVFPNATPAPPPPSQFEAGTSSAPPKPVTLEDISAQLCDLTTYTHDGFRWAGDVFTDLYSKWVMKKLHRLLRIRITLGIRAAHKGRRAKMKMMKKRRISTRTTTTMMKWMKIRMPLFKLVFRLVKFET